MLEHYYSLRRKTTRCTRGQAASGIGNSVQYLNQLPVRDAAARRQLSHLDPENQILASGTSQQPIHEQLLKVWMREHRDQQMPASAGLAELPVRVVGVCAQATANTCFFATTKTHKYENL